MSPPNGYHRRAKIITLPDGGLIPPAAGAIDDPEQGILLSQISCLWNAVATVAGTSQRRMCAASHPTGAESHLGDKRWRLSHGLFIPMMAIAGHALSNSAKAMREGRQSLALDWLVLGARLRRGLGSLFLYGTDFEPCSVIYRGQIRNHMPPGFTGYQIRERQNAFQPGVEAFKEAFPKCSSDPFIQRIRSIWIAAELRYHELHEKCMVRAVPKVVDGPDRSRGAATKGESLRAEYYRQHHEMPRVDEAAFGELDQWFGIERHPVLTRAEYVYEVSDIMEQVLADLLVGHRLEPAVAEELFDSMKAVLIVFANWAGPIPDTSPFSAKCAENQPPNLRNVPDSVEPGQPESASSLTELPFPDLHANLYE